MVRLVRFREATSDDREAITSLHISVSKQTYSGILPADYLTDRMPEEKTRLWERRLAQGIDPARLALILAEEGSTLAGFACFVFDDETDFGTYLHNLYVAPSHQGKGVARGLLAAGVNGFSEERLEQSIHLLTIRENHQARAFYERLSGRMVEERQNVMTRQPQVRFVRYQWPTARALRTAAELSMKP